MSKTANSASPGQFARQLQMTLAQKVFSGWQGRARSMLVINCGRGRYLPMLWEAGFDITATEQDSEARASVAAKVAGRIETMSAVPDHLPFDNREFDWVILQLDTTNRVDPASSINEAMRVAARGLAVTFWNNSSLAGLFGGRRFKPARSCRFSTIAGLMSSHGRGTLHRFSTLLLPPGTWHGESMFASLNNCSTSTPFGAYAVLRLDMAKTRPLTPLGVRLRNFFGRIFSPEPTA